ncbi:hypothetical protein INT48_003038 [Thamnidium elegans]|uniref:RING-type E3 ubiquitin transferase n=1 Tax=Thamnidium elegans TaxID=101142 RepID=A0A8H7SJC7_9FUNG|nr:hypothetical protein INT48_003038 [Thamnidium elegans]
MSDLDEECDFQIPVNIPLDIFKRKRNRTQVDNLEYEKNEEHLVETSVCTICQSDWTNNGIHGIVGLKCGHVFGKDCIDKHIRLLITKYSVANCPICEKVVTKSEPRRIWPNKFIPCNVDDLKLLKKESEEADMMITQLEEANKLILEQIDQVKFELNLLASESQSKSTNSQPSTQPTETLPSKFVYQHLFSTKDETYKVMDIVPSQDMAVLSVWNKPKQQYGIRKVNLYDPKQTEFIPNHSGQIKDIKSVLQNMVLSTGLDKTLKLTSLTSKQVVQSYKLEAPGWSCTIDAENPNTMYCGLTNNTVLVFDIRNTKNYIHKLVEPCEPKIYSPIHSMDVAHKDGTSIVICSNLEHIYGWSTVNNEDYEYMPFEYTNDYKSFNTTYQDNVLLSSLRNKTSTRYEVRQIDSTLKSNLDWYFNNDNHKQTLISRNTHFKREEQVFICFSENDKLKIRNEKEVQVIKVNKPIVDTKYEKDHDILAILTEDELTIFKFFGDEMSQ